MGVLLNINKTHITLLLQFKIAYSHLTSFIWKCENRKQELILELSSILWTDDMQGVSILWRLWLLLPL